MSGMLSLAEGIERMADDWDALGARCGANPSGLPGWVSAARRALQPPGESRLFVQREGAALSAVIPFRLVTRSFSGIRLRMLDLMAGTVRYHYDFPVTTLPHTALATCLNEARGQWDVAFAGNVVIGSPFHAALLELERSHGCIVVRYEAEKSPYLPLETTWDALIATKPKKFRYNVRRRVSDFSPEKGFELRWCSDVAQTAELLQHMLVVERGSWKADVGKAVSDSQHETAYYKELLPWLAQRGFLRANVLLHQSQPIAYNLCCTYGRWTGQLKTSYLEAHAAGSPGAFLIDRSIERAIGEGCGEFDFLGDANPHKLAWTQTVRAHEDVFAFRRNWRAGPVGLLKRWVQKRRRVEQVKPPASDSQEPEST